MPTANLDPRTYFKFKSCGYCRNKPCDSLRFGHVYNGKFIFVRSGDIGFGLSDCPFLAQSFDEIEQLLKNTSLLDLIHHIDGLLSDLSLADQMRFNQNDYVMSYDDFSGRVRFLRAMWDGRAFGVVRVPLFFIDKEMSRWLYANQSLDFTLKNNPKQEEEKAAATDAMASHPAAPAAPPPEKKQEITEIEVFVEGEEGPRKVNSNGTLEIVPYLQKPRKVTCREINGVPVTWAMSGYHYETKEGAKAEFEIKSWGIPTEILWFPHEKPKRIFITAKDKNGKQKSATLNVYAGNKEAIEVDFANSDFLKFLKEFFSLFSDILYDTTGKKIEIKFLQGAAGLTASFKEHSDTTVFYKYDFSAGFSPLVGLALTIEFSIIPVKLPQLGRFAKYLKSELSVSSGISVNGHISKDSPENAKFSIKPEAKIIGVGVSIQSDLTGGNDSKSRIRWHVIDAKVGGETSINAEFDPVQEKQKIGFLTSIKWSGLAGSGYIVALDGLFSYKKDIVFIGEKTWVDKKEWLIFK
jgi:hypothetical protein